MSKRGRSANTSHKRKTPSFAVAKKPVSRPKSPGKTIVGIGASAGGLQAITELLEKLPRDPNAAFVVIMHLLSGQKSNLAEILSKRTKLAVIEIKNGMALEPNRAYIMPPDTFATLAANNTLKLSKRNGARKNKHSPFLPIDHFFRSLAQQAKTNAIGVLLSGTGSDGTAGLKAIKARGGTSLAQDQTSAEYGNMPESAVRADTVDYVLPPKEIAKVIIEIGSGHKPSKARIGDAKSDPTFTNEGIFKKILQQLSSASNINFTDYKYPTLKRRIARRMGLQHMKSPGHYLTFLEKNPEEVKALHQDVLINVTKFFRDPEVFTVLKKKIFPQIARRGSRDAPLRIWIPGCSTGEEAYSLAISLIEFLEQKKMMRQIQIFGTDVSDAALAKAREGIYGADALKQVSKERLARFFTPLTAEAQEYQISKSIRNSCIFAKHNMVGDTPFSNIDLVSCRNVLIYFDATLQKRAISVLHYALRSNGFLVLGTAETTTSLTGLFTLADRKYKIYSKASVPTPRTHLVFTHHSFAAPKKEVIAPSFPQEASESIARVEKQADRIVLTKHAPAGVVVTDDMTAIQFRGSTGKYFEPPSGKATFNLLKIAREGLRYALMDAVREAKKKRGVAKRKQVVFHSGNAVAAANIEVIPLNHESGAGRYFLILFENVSLASLKKQKPGEHLRYARDRKNRNGEITQLKRELASTNDYMQTLVEKQDTANEALRSSNEEFMSSNEELQSTNEELETAKEELQSTNEELNTLNAELQSRNTELTQANNDLTNLLNGVSIPIIILSKDVRVRHFTVVAAKVFNLIQGDIGRPLGNIKPNIDEPNLEQLVKNVIRTGEILEKEIKDTSGKWYSLRIWPYKNAQGESDGAIIAMFDVHMMKTAMAEMETARKYAETVIDTIPESILVLDHELRVVTAGRHFYEQFSIPKGTIRGKPLSELGNGEWNIPEFKELLAHVYKQNTPLVDSEISVKFPRIGERLISVSANIFSRGNEKNSSLILVAMRDVTEERKAADRIHKSQRQLQEAQAIAHVGSWEWDLESESGGVSDEIYRIFGIHQGNGALSYEEYLKHVHPNDLPYVKKTIDTAIEEHKAFRVEHRIVKPNNAVGTISVIGRIIRDGKGDATKLRGIIQDITTQKRLQDKIAEYAKELEQKVKERTLALEAVNTTLAQEKMQAEAILENIGDGVYFTDKKGIIKMINYEASIMLGWKPEEAIGKPFYEVAPMEDEEGNPIPPEERLVFRVLASGKSIVSDPTMPIRYYVRKNKTRFPISYTKSAVILGSEILGTIEVFRDATKEAEVDKAKSEFVSLASHQLRTPLSVISMYAELLKKTPTTNANKDDIYKYSGEIYESVHRMAELINDLLNVTRIDTETLAVEIETVDPKKTIEAALKELDQKIKEKGLTIEKHYDRVPATLKSDRQLIQIVFQNLLANAVKYTPKRGTITVDVVGHPDHVQVAFRDTGYGIPLHQQPEIFKKLFRADNVKTIESEGTGLGLYIVKSILGRLGGSISFESKENEGSVFYVKLPRQKQIYKEKGGAYIKHKEKSIN